MADDLEEQFRKRAKTFSIDKPASGYSGNKNDDRGILSGLSRGYKSSSTGILMGNKPQAAPEDETAMEHLAALAAETAGDVPAMAAGGAMGGAGGPLGSSAVAFALPAFIKTGASELNKLRDKPNDITASKGLGALYNLGKETGKSATVGVVTGLFGKLAPAISKIPGMDKLSKSNAGRAAISAGLEYAGLTGGKAAVEGELPSKQELMDNALVLGGFKASGVLGEKSSKAFKKYTSSESITEGITSMVPERLQKKATELGAKAYEAMPEKAKDISKSILKLRPNKKQKEYSELIRKNIGDKMADIVESQFEMKDAKELYETEYGKFKPSDGEDMIHYRQKRGNPNIKGDTYESLSKRMSPHAKEFVKNAVGPHIEKTLKAWNESLLTEDINPREALKETYLRGLYEFDPKNFNDVYKDMVSEFKTDNPALLMKRFLTYSDAAKFGFKPKFNNIFDLIEASDAISIKTLSNLKLLDTVKKQEVKDKTSLIVKYPDYKEISEKATTSGKKTYEKAVAGGLEDFTSSREKSLKSLKERTSKLTSDREVNSKKVRETRDEKITELKEAFVKKKGDILDKEGTRSKLKEIKESKESKRKEIRESRDKKLDSLKKDFTSKKRHTQKEKDTYWKEVRRIKQAALKDIKTSIDKIEKTKPDTSKRPLNIEKERNLLAVETRSLKDAANKQLNAIYNEARKKTYSDINVTKSGLSKQYKDIFNDARKDQGSTFKKEKALAYDKEMTKYYNAKEAGFVKFEDPFLKVNERPAFVHPDLADSLRSVFNKDAYEEPSALWKALRSAKQTIQGFRVKGSLFHYVPLTESLIGSLGIKGFRFKKIAIEGRSLRNNKEFAVDAARHGLNLGKTEPGSYEQSNKLFDYVASKLPTKSVKGMDKAARAFRKGLNYIFDEYHPNIKAVTYKDFVDKEISRKSETGRAYTEKETGTVKREMADLVNNIYGGQVWENIRLLNDRNNLEWTKMAIGYPDWCSDSKTRCMTKDGWKYYHEISIGDEILAFDPKTKTTRWNKLNDMYVNDNYDGDMIKIKNYNRAIMVTPYHTCYVEHSNSRKNLILEANELNSRHLIPRSAPFELSKDKIISDYLVKIAGWLVTDGHIIKRKRKKKDGSFSHSYVGKITQAKPYTVKILKDMELSYYKDEKNYDHGKFKSNYSKYVFHVPLGDILELKECGLNIEDKELSWGFLSKLSKRQLELLYDTMMLADGTGQNRFCGTERAVFFMTLIQTMLGSPTTFYQQENNCWRTRILKHKAISCVGKKVVNYKGSIWCPSVDTGFWVAEREGLIFITGNTISTARQAADAFGVGTKGRISREYWMRYMVSQFAYHGLMKFALGGLTQTDPKKSVKGVRFDPNKAVAAIVDPDPAKWLSFPLPDIDVKIAGFTFNPGRDSEGRKLYAHGAKQMLEVGGYFTDSVSTLFGKSNVLIQMYWKQLFGKDPSGFVIRGKYKYGDRLPWDATEPRTAGRLVSRSKELVSDVLPFAVGTVQSHGVAPFVATAGGAVPISKGMTPHKATPHIEKALKNKDMKALSRVKRALRENNYKTTEINRKINTIKNEIKREKRNK